MPREHRYTLQARSSNVTCRSSNPALCPLYIAFGQTVNMQSFAMNAPKTQYVHFPFGLTADMQHIVMRIPKTQYVFIVLTVSLFDFYIIFACLYLTTNP